MMNLGKTKYWGNFSRYNRVTPWLINVGDTVEITNSEMYKEGTKGVVLNLTRHLAVVSISQDGKDSISITIPFYYLRKVTNNDSRR